MSKINSKNTIPEKILKKEMKFQRFIYQPKNIFGKPDFMHKTKKIVVFVDGCFWHKCPIHFTPPKSNKKYWNKKIEKNIIRAKEIELAYHNLGWKVLRIWEHDLTF